MSDTGEPQNAPKDGSEDVRAENQAESTPEQNADYVRPLGELAVAAVEASQTPERVLHIHPGEYHVLVKDYQGRDSHFAAWGVAVTEAAIRMGVSLPLPSVKVVVGPAHNDGSGVSDV